MKKLTLSTFAAAGVLVLAGCGASNTSNSTGAPSSSTHTSVSASAPATGEKQVNGALEISDAWVKAANNGMTAAFGSVTNTSDEAVTITGASTVATDMAQLHVTEIDPTTGTSQMKETKDGFTIQPGENFTMEPGGSHVMLMDLKCSLGTGSILDITFETTAGNAAFTFEVRDYQGAQEQYAPGDEESMAAMDASKGPHGDMSDHGNHSMAADDASVAPACAQ